MNKFIKEFSCECKKNREYLNYTIEDVCDFLVDVSEEEYQAFELGKKVLDKIQHFILIKQSFKETFYSFP